MQIGWELYHHLLPHLSKDSTLTVRALVESMPIAFVDDLPPAQASGPPAGMSTEQAAELERRRNLKRVNTPQ